MTSRLYSNFWPMGRPLPFVCACAASGTSATRSIVMNFFIFFLPFDLDAGSPFPRQERTAGRVGRNLKSGNISLGGVGEQKNDASLSECLLSKRPDLGQHAKPRLARVLAAIGGFLSNRLLGGRRVL